MKDNSLGIFMIIGSIFFALIICNKETDKAINSRNQTAIIDSVTSVSGDMLDSTISVDTTKPANQEPSYSYQNNIDTIDLSVEDDTTFTTSEDLQPIEKRKTFEEIQREYELKECFQKNDLALANAELKEFEDSMNKENIIKTNRYTNDMEVKQLLQRKLNALNNNNNSLNYNNIQGTNPNVIEVDGYNKSNGTYVSPYYRTAPNNTIRDNFSTYPNVNLYTGQTGARRY